MAKKKKPGKSGGKKSRPTVPSVPQVSVSEAEWEHQLKIRELAASGDRLWSEYYNLKAQAKDVKAEAAGIDQRVRSMLRDGPTPMLFDKHEDGTPKSGDAGSADAGNASWREAPLRESLRKPKRPLLTKSLNALVKAEITTIGKLEDLRGGSFNGAWFESVPGLGREGADEVENAVIDWLSIHRDRSALAAAGAAIDNKQRIDGAGELTASLLPWKADVVKYIEDFGGYGPKVTAAKLKKGLAGTTTVASDIESSWTCDGLGIHVDKFRGSLLPVLERTIAYVEASNMIRALHAVPSDRKSAAAGEAASEFPDADATREEGMPIEAPAAVGDWKTSLVAMLIERFTIVRAMSAYELCGRVGGSGGPLKGFANLHWQTMADWIEVSGFIEPPSVETLTYPEAAKILKRLLKDGSGGKAA